MVLVVPRFARRVLHWVFAGNDQAGRAAQGRQKRFRVGRSHAEVGKRLSVYRNRDLIRTGLLDFHLSRGNAGNHRRCKEHQGAQRLRTSKELYHKLVPIQMISTVSTYSTQALLAVPAKVRDIIMV